MTGRNEGPYPATDTGCAAAPTAMRQRRIRRPDTALRRAVPCRSAAAFQIETGFASDYGVFGSRMKRTAMPIQIANPALVAKIVRLAASTGLSEVAVVERAVEALLAVQPPPEANRAWHRMDAILARLDRLPDRADAADPLDWDENGLPR
jgi:antitoxin VapB